MAVALIALMSSLNSLREDLQDDFIKSGERELGHGQIEHLWTSTKPRTKYYRY